MYKIVVEIPKGWGAILVVKKWKFRGGGGAYVKFPPQWGYGYFLELQNAGTCKIGINCKGYLKMELDFIHQQGWRTTVTS